MSSKEVHPGDNGTTSLLGEGRWPKFHPRFEALGTLDEASAALGLARALSSSPHTSGILASVQRDLYAVMAEVAATPDNVSSFQVLKPGRLEWMENLIESLSAEVPPPRGFILPGDSPAGAALALGRTIVRRAERRMAELKDRGEIKNALLLSYLNRLSTLCFTLELMENQQAGKSTQMAKDQPDAEKA